MTCEVSASVADDITEFEADNPGRVPVTHYVVGSPGGRFFQRWGTGCSWAASLHRTPVVTPVISMVKVLHCARMAHDGLWAAQSGVPGHLRYTRAQVASGQTAGFSHVLLSHGGGLAGVLRAEWLCEMHQRPVFYSY